MTELIQISMVVIIVIMVFTNHWQNKSIDKQQSQIDFLRETLTEFMNKTTEYVSAQNDTNEAVIRTLEKDDEYIQSSSRTLTALAAHVSYLDGEMQKKCNNTTYNKLGGHG
jgi:uncharacterized protein YoxC